VLPGSTSTLGRIQEDHVTPRLVQFNALSPAFPETAKVPVHAPRAVLVEFELRLRYAYLSSRRATSSASAALLRAPLFHGPLGFVS
jgi:hypothetical protein